MKTSELTGAQLDYWVAKALGLKPELFGSPVKDMVGIVGGVPPEFELDGPNYDCFMPSRMWAQGGPIIERERIMLVWDTGSWAAEIAAGPVQGRRIAFGGTALEAAMRAFVTSKYGDEATAAD